MSDEEEEAPPSSEEMGDGEDEFEDLSEKQIVEHKHTSMEAFMKAVQEGDASAALKAFEALHGLDHAAWEKEDSGAKDEPEEGPTG
jgi:hypothetical protein